jgi:Transposase DDE domain
LFVGDHYSALLRARRRRDPWSSEDQRLYQRHRWRSKGFYGEAKTWHGLARAVRRGLGNMKIQAYPTAAAINLKRLAAAILALLARWMDCQCLIQA